MGGPAAPPGDEWPAPSRVRQRPPRLYSQSGACHFADANSERYPLADAKSMAPADLRGPRRTESARCPASTCAASGWASGVNQPPSQSRKHTPTIFRFPQSPHTSAAASHRSTPGAQLRQLQTPPPGQSAFLVHAVGPEPVLPTLVAVPVPAFEAGAEVDAALLPPAGAGAHPANPSASAPTTAPAKLSLLMVFFLPGSACEAPPRHRARPDT